MALGRNPSLPQQAIGCGDYHSMVVTRDYAEVYTCGLNSYGQLGLGDTTNRKHLTMVEELDVRQQTMGEGEGMGRGGWRS